MLIRKFGVFRNRGNVFKTSIFRDYLPGLVTIVSNDLKCRVHFHMYVYMHKINTLYANVFQVNNRNYMYIIKIISNILIFIKIRVKFSNKLTEIGLIEISLGKLTYFNQISIIILFGSSKFFLRK